VIQELLLATGLDQVPVLESFLQKHYQQMVFGFHITVM
jgi:hypothetical protein